MQSSSPGVRQLEFPGVLAQSEKCRACGIDHESDWRCEVVRMLNLLLTHVAGVEDTLGNVVGGIANIRGELEVIWRHVSKDAGGHTNKNTVDMDAAHVDVGTDTPSGWQQCVSQDNVGDTVVEVATPSCPQPQLSPQPAAPPGTELGHPMVVDLDNGSSQSEDTKSKGDGPWNCTPSPLSTTPNLVGKRVHTQSRARVVPCARQLLGVAAGAGKGKASAGATPAPISCAPRYTDPPGYAGITDFGMSKEPYFKPPVLQPKTKRVNCDLSLNYPEIIEYATHVQQLTALVN